MPGKHGGDQGGAKPGNNNAARQRVWTNAIYKALEQKGTDRQEALAKLALKLLEKVDSGDMTAIKELGDRLEGKPAQIIEGTGPNGEITLKVSKDDTGVL